MEFGNRYLEVIIASGIKIGMIQTRKALGEISEIVSVPKAYKIYSKKLVTQWREKGWIKFYPSSNKERSKAYVKLSELETASAMMDINNKVPQNIIEQLMQ